MEGKNSRILLSQIIAEKINNLIIEQKMEVGDKLPSENQLADLFEVSRPTIREAIKSLEAQNIVDVRRGDGTYVSESTGIADDPLGLSYIDKVQLADNIFEVRLMIEPEIAALAVERATDEEIELLGEINEQMQNTPYDDPRRLELDIQFHTLIAQCTKNAVFDRIIPVIYEAIQKGLVVLHDSNKSHVKAQQMHRQIYEAFKNRDMVNAKNAVASHIYLTLMDIRDRREEGKDENKEIKQGEIDV